MGASQQPPSAGGCILDIAGYFLYPGHIVALGIAAGTHCEGLTLSAQLWVNQAQNPQEPLDPHGEQLPDKWYHHWGHGHACDMPSG